MPSLFRNIGPLTQTKFLSSNYSTNNSDVSDLQFNNLTIGKFYRLSGRIVFSVATGDINVFLGFYPASSGSGTKYGSVSGHEDEAARSNVNILFKATSTSLYAYLSDVSGATTLVGGTYSFLTLEELNDYKETTKYT